MRRGFELAGWIGRLPTLSVGLAVLWLLTLLVVELGYSGQRRDAAQQLASTAHFAIGHPAVEVPARLLPVARAVLPGFESNEMFAFLRGKGRGQQGPQQELIELSAGAFATLDAHPYRSLGLVPARPALHAFATHLFLHAGWVHGLASVLLLLLVAPLLESLWGAWVLGGVAAAAGLAGAGAFVLAHGGADRALLGSGAILAALVAAALVRFRAEEVDFLRWLSGFVPAELLAPAWGIGVLWLGYEGLLWWAVQGRFPGVDNAVGYTAHAAGALCGAGAAYGLQRLGWEKLEERRVETPRPASRTARFDMERVRQARARGDPDAARAMLEAQVERSPRHRDAVTSYFALCVERGEPERAAPAMTMLIREELRRGADDVAIAQWRELTQHAPGARLEAGLLVRLAPIVQRVDGDESALVALQQALEAPGAKLGPTALAVAARMAAELDPALALSAARRALRLQKLDPGLRTELEGLVAGLAPGEASPTAEPKPEAPASVFYEESDRSAFGSVGDLSALEDFPNGVVSEAVPRELEEEALRLSLADGTEQRVAWSRLRAVSVAGVRGLSAKAVVLVDLLVDGGGSERPLSVVRLRSDRFDPRPFARGEGTPLDALRDLVTGLLAAAEARPLPDPRGGVLNPVRVFESLEAYHEQVLREAGRRLS